jgi:ribonuclease HI
MTLHEILQALDRLSAAELQALSRAVAERLPAGSAGAGADGAGSSTGSTGAGAGSAGEGRGGKVRTKATTAANGAGNRATATKAKAVGKGAGADLELTPLDAPIPDLPEYVAYTDGACANNQAAGMQPGGWAVVFADGRRFAAGGLGTNQIFELKAAIEALKRTPPGSRVTICSDSAYVVNAFLQNWFAGWDRRGWTNVKGDPVANQALWRELRSLAEARRVTWQKVKGHAGDELNNLADRLAVAVIPKGGAGP